MIIDCISLYLTTLLCDHPVLNLSEEEHRQFETTLYILLEMYFGFFFLNLFNDHSVLSIYISLCLFQLMVTGVLISENGMIVQFRAEELDTEHAKKRVLSQQTEVPLAQHQALLL